MITPASVKALEGSRIDLQQDDAVLRLTLLAPEGTQWSIINTEEPRNEWDSPNPGTRMVAFEVVAPESGELTFAVLALPCASNPVQTKLALRPLQAW
jgi:hypothetical protein